MTKAPIMNPILCHGSDTWTIQRGAYPINIRYIYPSIWKIAFDKIQYLSTPTWMYLDASSSTFKTQRNSLSEARSKKNSLKSRNTLKGTQTKPTSSIFGTSNNSILQPKLGLMQGNLVYQESLNNSRQIIQKETECLSMTTVSTICEIPFCLYTDTQ